jgi:hypothetical protein
MKKGGMHKTWQEVGRCHGSVSLFLRSALGFWLIYGRPKMAGESFMTSVSTGVFFRNGFEYGSITIITRCDDFIGCLHLYWSSIAAGYTSPDKSSGGRPAKEVFKSPTQDEGIRAAIVY